MAMDNPTLKKEGITIHKIHYIIRVASRRQVCEPLELTEVSDRGEQMQLTQRQLEG